MQSRKKEHSPLILTSLSTRRRSYPKWILISSFPLPTPILCTSIGNDVCDLLLSCHRAIVVPPSMNNVADSLIWILNGAPFPFASCYHTVVKELYWWCQAGCSINPSASDAQKKIIVLAMCSLIDSTKCDEPTLVMVLDSVKREIENQRAERLPFISFDNAILTIFSYLREVSDQCYLNPFLFPYFQYSHIIPFPFFSFLFYYQFFLLSFNCWVGIFPTS